MIKTLFSGFCVERHDQIVGFEPQPYWVVDVTVSSPGDNSLNLNWQKEREFNRVTASQVLNYIRTHKYAKVSKITKTLKEKQGPLALNTVQLLKTASSAFGIGPHQTMIIAERLYTRGLLFFH